MFDAILEDVADFPMPTVYISKAFNNLALCRGVSYVQVLRLYSLGSELSVFVMDTSVLLKWAYVPFLGNYQTMTREYRKLRTYSKSQKWYLTRRADKLIESSTFQSSSTFTTFLSPICTKIVEVLASVGNTESRTHM